MNKLREFYIHWMCVSALGVALLAAFIPKLVPKLAAAGQHPRLVWVLDHSTERIVFVVILFVLEQLIRKKFWKMLHPELDFSGNWNGYTTYTHVRIGKIATPLPFGTGQKVVIEQDCLNLRLRPSKGLDFNFSSRAIDIQDDGTQLVYAYLVEYRGVPDRPSSAYGYEYLTVVEVDKAKRPVKLEGKFAHCAFDEEPVFSGMVELFRQGSTGDSPAELS
jgi:hypothetical protein